MIKNVYASKGKDELEEDLNLTHRHEDFARKDDIFTDTWRFCHIDSDRRHNLTAYYQMVPGVLERIVDVLRSAEYSSQGRKKRGLSICEPRADFWKSRCNWANSNVDGFRI